MPGTNVGAPVQACPFAAQNAATPPAKKQESKHAVDLTFVDESGQPMPNIKVQLIFADDTSMEVSSNEKGEIKMPDVPPGQVKIVSDWHQLEVDNVVLLA